MRVPVQAVDRDPQYRPQTEVPAQNMDRDPHRIDLQCVDLHHIDPTLPPTFSLTFSLTFSPTFPPFSVPFSPFLLHFLPTLYGHLLPDFTSNPPPRVPVHRLDRDQQYRPITEVPAQNMDRDQHRIDPHRINPHRINLHRIDLHRIAKLRGVQQGSGLGIGEAGDAGELVNVGGEAVANLTETLNLFIVS